LYSKVHCSTARGLVYSLHYSKALPEVLFVQYITVQHCRSLSLCSSVQCITVRVLVCTVQYSAALSEV
jgi:hypothetical protein